MDDERLKKDMLLLINGVLCVQSDLNPARHLAFNQDELLNSAGLSAGEPELSLVA